jgi:hypothetical protein
VCNLPELFLFCGSENWTQALHMLSTHSASKLHPSPPSRTFSVYAYKHNMYMLVYIYTCKFNFIKVGLYSIYCSATWFCFSLTKCISHFSMLDLPRPSMTERIGNVCPWYRIQKVQIKVFSWARGMAQEVEYLLCRCKGLSSNSSPTKKESLLPHQFPFPDCPCHLFLSYPSPEILCLFK